jgi:hypothetical protein
MNPPRAIERQPGFKSLQNRIRSVLHEFKYLPIGVPPAR